MYTFSRIDCAQQMPGSAVDGCLRDLFSSAAIERVQPGHGIFWEEDSSEDIFLVLEGLVRLYRMLPDGRRVIVGFLFAGDYMGLSWQEEQRHTAEAVSQVKLQRISKSQFYDRVARTPLQDRFAHSQPRDEMCAAQDQMMLVLRRSADERVAAFLAFVADRTGRTLDKGSELRLAMPRIDIADYLGLTIETVSRSISKLRDRGVISLNGPSRVRIEKPHMLRQLAEGDESVLEYVMSKPIPAAVAA